MVAAIMHRITGILPDSKARREISDSRFSTDSMDQIIVDILLIGRLS